MVTPDDGFFPNASKAALEASGWRPSTESNAASDDELARELLTMVKEDMAVEAKEAVQLIAEAIRIARNPNDYKSPFRPYAILGNKRTLDITDLTAHHLEILEYALPLLNSEVGKAKITDILWLKTNRIEMANSAIESNLSVMERATIAGDAFGARGYLKRAWVLWARTGRKDVYKDRINAAYLASLGADKPEPTDATRVQLLEEFIDVGMTDDERERWITLAEQWSEDSLKQKHFDKAVEYLLCCSSICERAKEKARMRAFQMRAAELRAREARELRDAGASALFLESKFTAAIEAFRRLPKTKEKVAELHAELLSVQLGIGDELKELETSQDITPAVKQMRSEIRPLPTKNAILVLALYGRPHVKKTLIEGAKENIRQFPLQYLVSNVTVDDKGRVVYRKKSTPYGTPEEQWAVLIEAAFQQLRFAVSITGTLVEIGRQELHHRFDVDDRLFDELLGGNGFVPEGREALYKKGLLAGFRGEWDICCHILIPQIENSFRYAFDQVGIISSKLDSDLIQEERDLNSLLYETQVEQFLGEDLTFTLRGLFTERAGFNFRNELAHGRLHQDAFNHEVCPYIWAVAIHLLKLGKRLRLGVVMPAQQPDTPSPESDTHTPPPSDKPE